METLTRDDRTAWDQYLTAVTIANNATIHDDTGYTPHFLVKGCEMAVPLGLIHPQFNLARRMEFPEFVRKHVLPLATAFDVTTNADLRETFPSKPSKWTEQRSGRRPRRR